MVVSFCIRCLKSTPTPKVMESLQVKALLSGVFFGLWPLFMNKSGLSGNLSAMTFSALVLLFVAPFAIGEIGHQADIRWSLVVIAASFGAVGIVCFNTMLSKATPQSLGTLFVLMIVIQTAIPAIYQVIKDGGLTPMKGAGFVLAAVAAVLLTKG